jgi:hypothetical protein
VEYLRLLDGAGAVVLSMNFFGYDPLEPDSYISAAEYWDYYAEIGRTDMAGRFFAYGGDWGDNPNDGSFQCSGIISADRTLQPEIAEVKYIYAPIRFRRNYGNEEYSNIQIINEKRFTDTSRYIFKWELLEDGRIVDSGTFETEFSPIAPGGYEKYIIEYHFPEEKTPGGEYFINLRAVLKEDSLYAEAGHIAAWEQFPLEVLTPAAPPLCLDGAGTLEIEETAGMAIITGGNFEVMFDKETGLISSFTYSDQVLLKQGPRPNYWRVRMCNDRQSGAWAGANQDMRVRAFSVRSGNEGKTAEIHAELILPNAADSVQTIIYTVYGSGEIHVASSLTVGDTRDELLKFGAELTLPREFEIIHYYGEGPHESYQDRRQSAKVGLYSTTVSDSFFPFVRPQTSGNRTGVRWIALEAPGMPVGLAVVGVQPLEASALRFAVSDFAGRTHPYRMPKTDYTILNIDQISAGMGGGACGPATLNQYRLFPDGEYAYEYVIMPHYTESGGLMERSKIWRD